MRTPHLADVSMTGGIPWLDGPANDDYAWDDFNSSEYVDANYRDPFDDDLHILQKVRNHFVRNGPVHGKGIDIGAGANLYPTLAMLPFCREIELVERSANNRAWLEKELRDYSDIWDQYWHRLAPHDAIYSHISPREAVNQTATVKPGNIFDLPRRRWSIGTMFFVAESISPQLREFNAAVERFVGALRPGAPFAAAFMNRSRGYNAGIHFPAVPVTEADVRHALERHVDDVTVELIFSGKLLRRDYTGMILALGRAGKVRL